MGARRLHLAVALALLALAAAPTPAGARPRPGSFDRSFGSGEVRGVGVVNGGLFGNGVEDFAGLVLSGGGRIVLAGDTDDAGDLDYALGALRPNGRFDTGFGELPNHVIMDGISGDDTVNAVAPARGGQFYIAAESDNGQARFGLARFGISGGTDAGFGGGTVATAIGTDAAPRALAVQKNGRPVAAGRTDTGGVRQIALVRYLTNGLPDPAFGGDGIVTTKINDNAEALDVEVARNGRIVVAGVDVRPSSKTEAVVLRYRPNGSLDPSFGKGGIARLRIGGRAAALALEVGARGKVVVAGFGGGNVSRPFVARLTAAGKRDRSFGGGDGLVKPGFGQSFAFITDLALQRNGKIVLAGIGGDVPGIVGGALVARLRGDGRLDRRFANRGTRLFLLGATGGSFPRLAILPNGKILVAGKLAVFPDTTGFFAVRLFGDPVRR
jgi:uncharacterized delta-60 repeat protein